MRIDELTLDELELLLKWHEADVETRADVLAILINGRRRDTSVEECKIISLEGVRKRNRG